MKALIFDFDGTIADSFETLLGVFEEIHARPKKLTAKEISQLRGLRITEIIKYLGIKRWQVPRLLIKARPLIAVRITGVKTFAGTPQTIKKLYQNGHPMYILSTNNADNIALFLKNNGLDGYFTRLYGNVGLFSKAAALRKIIQKESLNKTDCAYIGDEARDIEAAKKAGVMAVGVGWGFNNPRAIKSAKPGAFAAKPADLLKIFN